ncbi:hypothetical protein K456DRAFT_1342237 [Colletotrichum gloeosporioides 23]|nr:hypothetical protein K456DRAFT_1342237 [Colletotrichum gloeosporioides 23]
MISGPLYTHTPRCMMIRLTRCHCSLQISPQHQFLRLTCTRVCRRRETHHLQEIVVQKILRTLKGPVFCIPCGLRFPRNTELNKHNKRLHDKPRIPCPVLGCHIQFFSDKKKMYRHVRSAHSVYAANPKNKIPIDGGSCPFNGCVKYCTRRDNLKRHIREKHQHMNRGKRVLGSS